MKALKVAGIVIMFFATTFTAFCYSANFWPSTNGKVIEAKKSISVIDQTPTTAAAKKPNIKNTVINTLIIKYEYFINGHKYQNDMASILSRKVKVNEGSYTLKNGSLVIVKYLPFIKSFSILEVRIPFVLITFMFIIGMFLMNYYKIKTSFLMSILNIK